MTSPEHEAINQTQQVTQLDAEIEKNALENSRVFWPASGNRTTWFKFKANQELHVTIQVSKSAEVVIKQFASQKM